MPVKRHAPSISFSEAYHAAQSFLIHVGAAPTSLDEPVDGVVEFSGNGYTSRLRYDDAPVTQRAILALLRSIDEDDSITPILFSATGFTGSAQGVGENLSVALFVVTQTGDIVPSSPAARHLMPREPFEPPFLPVVDEDEQDRSAGISASGPIGVADHEWLDCQVCGTTHHPDANFCHRCGANLTRRNRIVPTARTRASFQPSTTAPPSESSPGLAHTSDHNAGPNHANGLRCRNCGSTDIEALADRSKL